MSKPVRPETGKEEYLSTSEGIGGKLRKIPEDFEVLESVSYTHLTLPTILLV